MTPKQKYLFDLTGYLHLKNVLSPEELRDAQAAIERCRQTPPDQLPPGIESQGEGFSYGFSFDKALEALTLHPVTWPLIKELTRDKPRLNRGTLAINTHEKRQLTPFHCAREDLGWITRRYEVKDGEAFANDLVAFFYFTDVFPGDGGLVVIPGSHKSEFERPEGLFFPDVDDPDPELHPAMTNITPRAGDVVLISELLTHGVLIWKPMDRDRRFLILRYKTQYFEDASGDTNPVPEEVLARLSPETLELTEPAFYTDIKEIAKQDRVTLTID